MCRADFSHPCGSESETDQRVVSVPVGWEELPVTDQHTAADA